MAMKRERFTILLGAILMQLSVGAIYSWALFNEAIHDKFGWEFSDIIITYSLIIFVFAFTTIFSGRLLDKFGPRIIGTIGAILYGTGVMLTSRADSLHELYIYYGIIAGIGVGFVYVCPLTTCIKWFPKKKGLVTGIVIGAFGLGSLVFKSIIQTSIVDNGISETFLKLGIIYLILTLIGARLLKDPCAKSEKKLGGGVKGKVFRVRTMIQTKNFYFIWISYFFACIGGLLIIGSATEIGLELANLTFEQAAGSVAIIAIFNAVGRLFWGTISDHIGYKKSAIIMFLLTALALILMSYLQLTLMTFYTLTAIITFCFGGFLVLYPTITSEYFGTTNLGRNYGVIYQAYGIAALCGPLLLKNTTGYRPAFLIAGIISAIGALFILQIKK